MSLNFNKDLLPSRSRAKVERHHPSKANCNVNINTKENQRTMEVKYGVL